MKQAILILSLGLLAACYNPRPIIMTVTKIQKKNESEQKEVWGQVGNRVLRAVMDRLPDSLKVGSEITLAAPHKRRNIEYNAAAKIFNHGYKYHRQNQS